MDLTGPALRVAGLWGAWLLLMLFHVELGLMPLFHGASVEIESRVAPQQLPRPPRAGRPGARAVSSLLADRHCIKHESLASRIGSQHGLRQASGE